MIQRINMLNRPPVAPLLLQGRLGFHKETTEYGLDYLHRQFGVQYFSTCLASKREVLCTTEKCLGV